MVSFKLFAVFLPQWRVHVNVQGNGSEMGEYWGKKPKAFKKGAFTLPVTEEKSTSEQSYV